MRILRAVREGVNLGGEVHPQDHKPQTTDLQADRPT